MCEYCESIKHKGRKTTESDNCELMENFPIFDEHSEKEIVSDGNSPVQYIRRYKEKYYLVTEFADDDGNAIFCQINNCPMCGRRLIKA